MNLWLNIPKCFPFRRWHVSRGHVARLMRKHGIRSHLRKKWVVTTDSKHPYPVAENLLNRAFNPTQLSKVWVSDITYIPSRSGWLYLTIVMDLADRQIIGWNLSKSLTAQQTTIVNLKQAIITRSVGASLMLHSDRGVQYACGDFVKALGKYAITQSISRKANCWDNTPAESFFKTLKSELFIFRSKFEGLQDARQHLFDYIEIW